MGISAFANTRATGKEDIKLRVSIFVHAAVADAIIKSSAHGNAALCRSGSDLDQLQNEIGAMEKEFAAFDGLTKGRFEQQVKEFKTVLLVKCCKLRGVKPPPVK